MNPEFRFLEGNAAAYKSNRGKSYRAQVIETLWMMAFFAVAFIAGALSQSKAADCASILSRNSRQPVIYSGALKVK